MVHMLLCWTFRQIVYSSGGRIKHTAAVPICGYTDQIEVCAQHLVANRDSYRLKHIAYQIHDMNMCLVVSKCGQEERLSVVSCVCLDEKGIGGQGPPCLADNTEAAPGRRTARPKGGCQNLRNHASSWPVRLVGKNTSWPSPKPTSIQYLASGKENTCAYRPGFTNPMKT